MNLDYVSKIKFGLKRYKTIATDKATSRVLDGSYNSIYKGRSMNFDELREYVPGDDIKDIDWKATSRSQKVLIRQYIAEKRHNIMLVMDANRRMLASTKTGEDKGEVALMAGGTPLEFNTIAVCDGIAMGHDGMSTSCTTSRGA